MKSHKILTCLFKAFNCLMYSSETSPPDPFSDELLLPKENPEAAAAGLWVGFGFEVSPLVVGVAEVVAPNLKPPPTVEDSVAVVVAETVLPPNLKPPPTEEGSAVVVVEVVLPNLKPRGENQQIMDVLSPVSDSSKHYPIEIFQISFHILLQIRSFWCIFFVFFCSSSFSGFFFSSRV